MSISVVLLAQPSNTLTAFIYDEGVILVWATPAAETHEITAFPPQVFVLQPTPKTQPIPVWEWKVYGEGSVMTEMLPYRKYGANEDDQLRLTIDGRQVEINPNDYFPSGEVDKFGQDPAWSGYPPVY